MAGSIRLNERFSQAVKDLVGEDQFYDLRKRYSVGYEEAMKQFDRNIKTAFRGEPDEEYFVPFSTARLDDDPANELRSNCWTMKA